LAQIVSEPESSIFPKGLVYMFCSPIVKLKSDKIPLKRLSACLTPATKRKQALLYKKILKSTIKAFRISDATTAGTDIIESTPEIKRIAGLRAALECLATRDSSYAHDRRWGDGNGYAHVRGALLGPALAIPLADGKLLLGTWQQVVVCDFDNRPSTRDNFVQLLLPS
jgi:thiamine phosphate synthase YjbQ (UPF0047 family)